MLGKQDDEGDGLPEEAKEEGTKEEGAKEEGAKKEEAKEEEAYMNLRQKLSSQTEEQFQDNVAAVVANKLQKDKTPWQECTRFWGELSGTWNVESRESCHQRIVVGEVQQ
jgi:hypothetical protein